MPCHIADIQIPPSSYAHALIKAAPDRAHCHHPYVQPERASSLFAYTRQLAEFNVMFNRTSSDLVPFIRGYSVSLRAAWRCR